jgi:hypothetical protein
MAFRAERDPLLREEAADLQSRPALRLLYIVRPIG